jgi:HD-GYP domain-containing protein (c-di-GMP phosphodiesterase class II)
MPGTGAIRRTRLIWTLLAVLILVGVVPLLISHYFLIGINRDSLETLEKKYLTRSAVGTASEIENLVESYRSQLLKITGGLQVQSATTLPGEVPDLISPAHATLISTYTDSDPNLIALRIVNRDGHAAASEPAGLDPEIVQELNVGARAALGGADHTGGFQYVDVVNQPAIVIAAPVREGQQVIGAAVALVSLRRIADRLREEGKGDVVGFVVDRTGRVLMHSQPVVAVQRPDYSQLKIVQEFMKAPVRLTQSYRDTITGKPTDVLGTVAPVNNPDWGVVVQKEESKAFASVRTMTERTILWVLVAIALAIVLGTLFAQRLSRPIRALAQTTHEISKGHYDQRADITSHNEIGELAENFNVMAGEIQKAVEQLKKAAHENNLLFINSVRMLAAAIDAKDPYTRGHSERVARYSMAIGKHLELRPDELRTLRISALLHDVGKIGIDDRILRKPGALNDDEFEVMKTHPAKGAAIMGGVAQLIDIVPGMKYHHEKWGGGGYPDGLKEIEIPMQARIVAIADTFDAMTTNRPYQKAMELSYVVEKIASFSSTRFDPRVVQAFIRAVKAGDIQSDEPVRGAA